MDFTTVWAQEISSPQNYKINELLKPSLMIKNSPDRKQISKVNQ